MADLYHTPEYRIHEQCASELKAAGVTPAALLDIGCSVGQFTRAWKAVFPELRSTGIDNDFVALSAAQNHCDRVICATLSNECRIVKFHYGMEYTTGSSYYPEISDHGFVAIDTWATTLDWLLPHGNFDVIKLDTQGSELDILIGGRNLVAKANIVIVETSGETPLNEGAPNAGAVLSHLKNEGFDNQEAFMHRGDRNYDWICTR